jgi:chromosome segregation ATPase
MVTYKKAIADLEALREKNNNAIKNQFEHLGRRIVLFDDAILDDTPFLEPVKEIRALEGQISEKERTIESWNELSDELDTINDAVKQIDADLVAKQSEIEPYFEAIGTAIIDAYDTSSSDFGELADAISSIIAARDNLEERQRELDTLESQGPDSFLGKTLAKGKGIVLKGTLRSMGAGLARALRELGAKACEAASADATTEPVRAALDPVETLIGDRARLREERAQLERNRAEVQNGRLEIEKRERMRNPVRNLGHEVDQLKSSIAATALELGRSYFESKQRIDSGDGSVEGALEMIGRLSDEASRAEALIARFRSAIEVDRLGEQIETKKGAKARLEAEIASLEKLIEELKGAKTTQTKARGSVASLESDFAALIGGAAEGEPEAETE